ncbi:YbaN family protein [Methanobacterium sp. MBAC-LM]|uniref:YbaN family protein n=1 Tax=Methanobacterium sp. MBAC-LM TaxID=3412034 RepID=UPI003C75EA8D
MEIKRLFFFSLGAVLFAVGAIGAVIPVLPTTPFILASFLCFGKSSKRAEKWISNNRYFGSYIENYKTKQGVPLDVKLKSILFLWIGMIASLIIFSHQIYLFILLLIIGTAVTAHILLLKTKKI